MEKSYIVPGMDTPARAKTVKKALLSSKNVLFVDVCPEKRRARIIAAGLFDERALFNEAKDAGFLLLYDSPAAYRRAISLETGGALRRLAAAIVSGVLLLACALLPYALRAGGASFGGRFLRAVFLAPLLLLHAPAIFGGARDLAAGRGSLDALCAVGTAGGLFSGAYGMVCAAYGVRSASGGFLGAAALLTLYAAIRAFAALLPVKERSAGLQTERAFFSFAEGLRGRPLLRELDRRAGAALKWTPAASCLPAAAVLAAGRDLLAASVVCAICAEGTAILFFACFAAALIAENLRARRKAAGGAGERKNADGARTRNGAGRAEMR